MTEGLKGTPDEERDTELLDSGEMGKARSQFGKLVQGPGKTLQAAYERRIAEGDEDAERLLAEGIVALAEQSGLLGSIVAALAPRTEEEPIGPETPEE